MKIHERIFFGGTWVDLAYRSSELVDNLILVLRLLELNFGIPRDFVGTTISTTKLRWLVSAMIHIENFRHPERGN